MEDVEQDAQMLQNKNILISVQQIHDILCQNESALIDC